MDEISDVFVEIVVLVVSYLASLRQEYQSIVLNDATDEISMENSLQFTLVTAIERV